MVEIAVIGAGSAGLVAARHLLRCGLRTCLFESRPFVGGAWSAGAAAAAASASPNAPPFPHSSSSQPQRPRMWDHLTPNLSRYTCSFSDYAWPPQTSAFPSLSQMDEYLQGYAETHVLNHENNDECLVQYGCTVTNISLKKKDGEGTRRSSSAASQSSHVSKEHENKDAQQYTVQWSDAEGVTQAQDFDGVVVATGFFAAPAWPKINNEDDPGMMDWGELLRTLNTSNHDPKKMIHSMHYQSPNDYVNQTVAVIGGSFSAHEIASDLISTTTKDDAPARAARVVNILGSHATPFVLPRHVQQRTTTKDDDNGASAASSFVPLDAFLYRRPQDAPQTPEKVILSPEDCQKRHQMLRSLIGNRRLAQLRKKGFSAAAGAADDTLPPMASISDDYLDLVIDNRIEVHAGRLINVSPSSSSSSRNNQLDLQLSDGSIVSGIDRIIACTGYRHCLNFLDTEILQTLNYDPTDPFAAFETCWETFHPQLPRLGFVGMYPGAYFGVMELQARVLARLFSNSDTDDKESLSRLATPQVLEKALEDSRTIRQHTPRAQFPRFDYIGMADNLARLVDLVPDPASTSGFGAKGMVVTPALYQPDTSLAEACLADLEQETKRINQQSDVIPRAVLSALIGDWTFKREIHDRLTGTIQKVHGNVGYSLQEPDFRSSLRYREDGFLNLPNGKTLEVFQQYDYTYNSNDGTLEIYFVEGGSRAHLFLSLQFQQKQDQDGYWVATNDHLCIQDLYKGTFHVAFDGIGATQVIMRYRVKGPKKDYESVTHLRPSPL